VTDFLAPTGWPAASWSLVAPIGSLVILDGDRGLDATSAQVGPVALGAVGLIGQDPVRAGTGLATLETGHPDAIDDGGELRTVTALPGGD
jgi:hypothetical protein